MGVVKIGPRMLHAPARRIASAVRAIGPFRPQYATLLNIVSAKNEVSASRSKRLNVNFVLYADAEPVYGIVFSEGLGGGSCLAQKR